MNMDVTAGGWRRAAWSGVWRGGGMRGEAHLLAFPEDHRIHHGEWQTADLAQRAGLPRAPRRRTELSILDKILLHVVRFRFVLVAPAAVFARRGRPRRRGDNARRRGPVRVGMVCTRRWLTDPAPTPRMRNVPLEARTARRGHARSPQHNATPSRGTSRWSHWGGLPLRPRGRRLELFHLAVHHTYFAVYRLKKK